MYKKDKERILAKFEPIIEEFNTVLTEINDLNAKYEEEYNRYTIPYHRENFDEDDEVKRELRNHFRDILYSPYITGIELPFTDQYNHKLKFRGDK